MSDSNIGDIAAQLLAKKGYKVTIIEGKAYSIRLLPATKGLALGLKLTKTFLPALGAFVDAGKREGLILPEDDTMFSEIAFTLTSQMDKLDLSTIINELLHQAICDDELIDFDSHFQANYSVLIQLVEFALKENFGDFFTQYLRSKGINLGELFPVASNEKAAAEILKTEQPLTESSDE